MHEMMPAAGVEANDYTERTFEKSESVLRKIRTAKLNQLVKSGAVEDAHALFSKLTTKGKVNATHS